MAGDQSDLSRSAMLHNQFREARATVGDVRAYKARDRAPERIIAAGLDALIGLSPHDLDGLTDEASNTLQRVTADIADGRPLTDKFADTFTLLVVGQLRSLRTRGLASGSREVRRQLYLYEKTVADLGVDIERIRAVDSETTARQNSSTVFTNKANSEAEKEARVADLLRILAGGLLAASFVATAVIAWLSPNDEQAGVVASLMDWLAHLALFLPLLLLVGYLARESAQHRHVSRELNYKAIQMQSASEFAAGLTDDHQRGVFLADLGKAMFATSFNQPGKDAQAGLPGDQLNAHVDRVIELAKAVNPRSGPLG